MIEIITIPLPFGAEVTDLENISQYPTIASGNTMQEALQSLITALNDDCVDMENNRLGLVIDNKLQTF